MFDCFPDIFQTPNHSLEANLQENEEVQFLIVWAGLLDGQLILAKVFVIGFLKIQLNWKALTISPCPFMSLF
jgi:hypothetical protein